MFLCTVYSNLDSSTQRYLVVVRTLGIVIIMRHHLTQYFVKHCSPFPSIGQIKSWTANSWAGELRWDFWEEREGLRWEQRQIPAQQKKQQQVQEQTKRGRWLVRHRPGQHCQVRIGSKPAQKQCPELINKHKYLCVTNRGQGRSSTITHDSNDFTFYSLLRTWQEKQTRNKYDLRQVSWTHILWNRQNSERKES